MKNKTRIIGDTGDAEVKSAPLSIRLDGEMEQCILTLAANWRPRLNKTDVVRMCVEEHLPIMERDAGLLPRAASPSDAVARLDQAASATPQKPTQRGK